MENIPKISTKTVVRTLVALIAMVNAILITLGKSPVDIDENTLYAVCSAVGMVVSAIWIWWKDNDIKPDTRLTKLQVQAINEMANSCEGDDPESCEEICENEKTADSSDDESDNEKKLD